KIVVHLAPVHLVDGAAVHAQQIDVMGVDQVEQAVEIRRVTKTNTHFHREQAAGGGGAQRTEDAVNVVGIAQEAAADVFLVNLGRGTAEVKIDARDGVAA